MVYCTHKFRSEMSVNRPTIIVATLLAVAMMLPFLYHWDSNTNRGFTFGYYGQFNTVSNALARFKGVTIFRSWHNCDVTLEEFGFDVKTSEDRLLKIYFG